LASGEQTGERGNRQASRLATRDWNVSRPLESRPLLLSAAAAVVAAAAAGAAAAGSPLRSSPRCWAQRLCAEVGGGGRGLDVVRGVVADGRGRGRREGP
jgi:hypothetical protein